MKEHEQEPQSKLLAEDEALSVQGTAESTSDTVENLGDALQEPSDVEPSVLGENTVDDVEGATEPSSELALDEAVHTAKSLTRVSNAFLIPKAVKVVGLVVIVLAAIAFGAWIGAKQNDPWRVESGLADYGGFSSESGSSDQIVIPGYGEILLDADTRDVMLILPNPSGNPCYFRFSILLKDGNEEIYTSGLVPPGKAIEKLRLNRKLEKGNYPAIIQIETFSMDGTLTPMNGANVETVLNFR